MNFAIAPSAQGAELRVMSFNIRYGTADDGANHWDHRKEFVLQTIRDVAPDLLGTQETLLFQREFLKEGLQEFEAVGVGRDDGLEKGEMAALFFRRARFEKLAEGHFWLSLTPDQPGSQGWDAALPRIATWVRLRDRDQEPPQELLFVNTHFDHRGQEARHESAKLLRTKLPELGQAIPWVVTGDFNASEGSPPYRALFSSDGNGKVLVDTFRKVHQVAGPQEGTFCQFSPQPNDGGRIDWIAASSDWEVISADIHRVSKDGKSPSDHFPVTAVVQFRGKP
jgi:endonuclease/exonuclease/phosphatase family metal-dependent hydrolase